MTRNIRIYLALETILAVAGGFILPVYVLYFRYYQVSIFQVAVLAAVFEATVLVAEIPTGILADRFGRQLSSAIGFFILAVSGLVFLTWRSFTGFLLAEILFGIAEAFISGAAEALAVDSIDGEQKDKKLQRLYIGRSRFRIIGLTGAMLLSSWLFVDFMAIAFAPVLIGGIVGFILCFAFSERAAVSGSKADNQRSSIFHPVRLMFNRLKQSSLLITIFILALVMNFSFEGADQYWQVLSTEIFNLDIAFFGLITAAGAVLAFLLVGPITRRFTGNLSLPLLILFLAGVIISGLPNSPAVFLPYLLVLYFTCRELVNPLFSIAINSIIGSEGRATFLSGYNMTCSVGEVASGLLVGSLAMVLGVPFVFLVCGALLVLFVFGSLFFRGSVQAFR